MNQYQKEAQDFLNYLYDGKIISCFYSYTPKNFGEINILGLLTKEKELTSGQIASMLSLKTSRVAALLNSLEEKKEIIRDKDKDDHRITIVKITKKGEDFFNHIYQNLIEKLSLAYQEIGTEEMNQFKHTLSKICQIYKENEKTC